MNYKTSNKNKTSKKNRIHHKKTTKKKNFKITGGVGA